MTVLQVCAYGADYSGNFIASLEALEDALKEKGIKTIYAFVEKASVKPWCKEIQTRTKVYFLPEARLSAAKSCAKPPNTLRRYHLNSAARAHAS